MTSAAEGRGFKILTVADKDPDEAAPEVAEPLYTRYPALSSRAQRYHCIQAEPENIFDRLRQRFDGTNFSKIIFIIRL